MNNIKGEIIITIMILSYSIGAAQDNGTRPEANRYPVQKYYEDSVHVFWTQYPYPFGPLTVKNAAKRHFVYPISFYCDLADTVEIALINEKDSVVYHAPVTSRTPPYFSLGYWLAGSNVDVQTLPETYFKRQTADKLFWAIVVDGKRKSQIEAKGLLRRGWCLWMSN